VSSASRVDGPNPGNAMQGRLALISETECPLCELTFVRHCVMVYNHVNCRRPPGWSNLAIWPEGQPPADALHGRSGWKPCHWGADRCRCTGQSPQIARGWHSIPPRPAGALGLEGGRGN
jgi:hypothetical protein